MENSNLPGSLSPCVRIFLETLYNEALGLTPAKSQPLVPFAQVAGATQPQTSAVELK